jgi:hypothetical protein
MLYDILRNFDSFSNNSPLAVDPPIVRYGKHTVIVSLLRNIWPGFSLTLFIRHRLYNYDEYKVYHTTTTVPLTRAVIMPAVSLVLTIILVLVSSIAAFLAIRDYQKRQGLPYPPGPRPLPLIGNLFDVPKEFSWLRYARLSQKYGKVYFAIK